MRLLHTSDWHLGRSFHSEGLLGAQSQFIDHLVETAVAERVDAVVVSGDIYDRALPAVDAVELASEALRRLLSARVRVVITSGNHDSASRLGFASDLIDMAGIHLRTHPSSVGSPVIVSDAYGEVAIYGVPYLEPDLVRESWQLEGRSHQVVLGEAMRRVHVDLAGRAKSTRSVVMAHAFVVGAAPCDSERDISVGGVSSVGLATFSGVDYAALGHLHGRHTLTEHVRYSGSPLAYSFSEGRHVKGSWLVELGADGLSHVEFVTAPVPRPLASVSGTLDDLLTQDRFAFAERSWVQATLTDRCRPKIPMDRLRTRFPHALVLKFEPSPSCNDPATQLSDKVVGRSDAEVVANFFTDVRGSPLGDEEAALMSDACDACRVQEDAAS
ncbi:MAG: exonuclease SbcCD subunit D [Nocardioidaceae bacterium]|nr:exonuclease SbcCD subunit D [Nocardioidaceae bacterium]